MPFITLDNLSKFLTKIKSTYATKTEVNAKQAKGNYVTYTANSNVTAGKKTNVTTYTYGQSPMVVKNGLVIGGTAANAGLVTRGISGVSPPDENTGACTTDHLYINYDSVNTYSRQVVLGAGTVGNAITVNTGESSLATNKCGLLYCAVRGDQMVNYVTAKIDASTATTAQIEALFTE